MKVTLERQSAPTVAARDLTNELDADLRGEGYDPCQHHGYTLEKLFVPNINFYVATVDGAPAGCGGIQFFDGFAELKRMYVRPAFRGTGVAAALIRKLELDAKTNGIGIVRLETGDKQLAALQFYTREGYRPCTAFAPYTDLDPFSIATSVFMEKGV